jgi:mannosyltransferase
MIDQPPTAPEVVVTNFHRRFTGVSATADAVVSRQLSQYRLCLVGCPLPSAPVPVAYRQALGLCRYRPRQRPFAIWHVRRNLEMAAAIFARDVLRLPIRIVFTSAAQRLHSNVPRRLIARMDAVVATTAKAASFVPRVAAIIPHGVDTERFTPVTDQEEACRQSELPLTHGIGIVGRIREEKGTDLFVDALLRVLPHRKDFSAMIIGRAMPGEAAFERSLHDRIQIAGLSDRFIFMGEQPPSRMPALMRSLSLLVAPARYEGYGMTPLEAMASGVPVVAANTGVYDQIIEEGRTGHVIPVGDLNALSDAILKVTGDLTSLRRMGAEARRTAVSKLSLQQEAAGYGDLFNRLWNGETFH